jgi:hypothetical protein
MISITRQQELLEARFRLSLNENERSTTMKLIYSLFMLVTLGLLLKNDPSKQPLLTAREIRDVQHRLNEIGRR